MLYSVHYRTKQGDLKSMKYSYPDYSSFWNYIRYYDFSDISENQPDIYIFDENHLVKHLKKRFTNYEQLTIPF